jgi:hypothetical protein
VFTSSSCFIGKYIEIAGSHIKVGNVDNIAAAWSSWGFILKKKYPRVKMKMSNGRYASRGKEKFNEY